MNFRKGGLVGVAIAFLVLFSAGCATFGGSGSIPGSKLDIEKCPNPGEFEDEVVVCIVNGLWKGEIFVIRRSGDATRLGVVPTGNDIHSYTLGNVEGEVMRFGARFASGSPADPDRIYVYSIDSFSAEPGDVVFFHMLGTITYRNTTSRHYTPLDQSQLYINFIPDRVTSDSTGN